MIGGPPNVPLIELPTLIHKRDHQLLHIKWPPLKWYTNLGPPQENVTLEHQMAHQHLLQYLFMSIITGTQDTGHRTYNIGNRT